MVIKVNNLIWCCEKHHEEKKKSTTKRATKSVTCTRRVWARGTRSNDLLTKQNNEI